MSYAVMPLSDYKAACDKVREKVDLTTVKFEETDFGFLRSEVFTVPQDSVYIFSYEFSDPSKFPDLYYSSPEWEGETPPGYFEPIDSNSAETASKLYAGVQYRIFIADSLGLTPKDILKASLLLDEETVVDFVPPPKIKSGELAEKVDEVYMAGASDFGLKGKGQGELVHFNNVHPIEHKVEVGLRSKNLVDMKNPTEFATGGRFEIIDDNTVRNYGCMGYSNATLRYRIYAPQGTQLTITFDHEFGGEATGTWNIISFGSSATDQSLVSGRVTTVGKSGYIDISFARKGGSGNNLLGWVDIKNLQVEIGTTPTAYTPFVADFSDCKVKACGKNLFNYEDFMRRWDNGEYYLDSGNAYYVLAIQLKPNTKYYLKANGVRGSGVVIMSVNESVNSNYDKAISITSNWGAENAVTTGESGKIYIGTPYAHQVTRELFENALVQIEYGSTFTAFEPYIGAEYTASADGTVEGVKSISPVMNLSTDKAGAIIDAECFLDPQAVITDLTNTVITLGGEI